MKFLKETNSEKGFAISGILYPILILVVFLVSQVLVLLGTRKIILDQARKQLVEAIDNSNKVYTNEELSYKVDKMLENTYPVGSIYISVSNTNPSGLFGGTWVAFGTGRTLVGINTSDSDFNTVKKTGGAKTHTLTVAQMPAHSGHYDYGSYVGSDGWYLSTPKLKELGIMNQYANRPWTTVYDNELTVNTKTLGSGQAHNNLQPYITVYMWERTA